MPKKESELAREQRAERIGAAIALLEAQKSEIEASGVVAPPGCYVARYQAKGAGASLLVLSTSERRTPFSPKPSRRMNIPVFNMNGKAGSQAHIDGVLAVIRRVQIDELTFAIDELKVSWSDLYSNDEKVGHRVE